jgi:hypothetical protein
MNYPSLCNESAKDWAYVGEGNKNLVVRYIGNKAEYVNSLCLRALPDACSLFV